MERPRSMPRYSASRFAGIAAAVLSSDAAAPAHDGPASRAGASRDGEAPAPLSTTSAAKRTRFLLPRRAFSRFRFSEEERHGRSRGGGAAAASEEGTSWGLARQREKRTSVPESAMAVAASARPAWDPPSAADDDMPRTKIRRGNRTVWEVVGAGR
uniref:Uncharacterized protein n=1 Tax=Arundo donax TaxID=35708 RepID=A0A0A9G1W8_ARUDO